MREELIKEGRGAGVNANVLQKMYLVPVRAGLSKWEDVLSALGIHGNHLNKILKISSEQRCKAHLLHPTGAHGSVEG